MDKGAAGIDATLAVFDAAGLGHAGMARTQPSVAGDLRRERRAVAHISATQDYNGLADTDRESRRSNLIDPARIVAEAQQARAGGAEVVYRSLHRGAEGHDGSDDNSGSRRDRDGERRCRPDRRHHVDVVQLIEEFNGRGSLGMGKMLSGMGDTTDCCGPRALDGIMVRVRSPNSQMHVRRRATQVSPIYLARMPYRILAVSAAARGSDRRLELTCGASASSNGPAPSSCQVAPS